MSAVLGQSFVCQMKKMADPREFSQPFHCEYLCTFRKKKSQNRKGNSKQLPKMGLTWTSYYGKGTPHIQQTFYIWSSSSKHLREDWKTATDRHFQSLLQLRVADSTLQLYHWRTEMLSALSKVRSEDRIRIPASSFLGLCYTFHKETKLAFWEECQRFHSPNWEFIGILE